MAGLLGGRRRPEEKSEADRQKMIAYKQTFGSAQGREVLIDLMNRYYVLTSHNGKKREEGQRSVVLDIMTRANVDMVQFDKLLKGEI